MDLKAHFVTAFAILLLSGQGVVAADPRINLTILDDTDLDRSRTNTVDRGDGKRETEKVSFRFKAVNRDFSAYEGLTVVAFIYSKNPFAKSAKDRRFELKKKLTSKPFKLAYNETVEEALGTVEFSHGTSTKGEGNVIYLYMSGDEYGGWAAELHHDGHIVGTFFSSSKSKKAYGYSK